MTGRPLNVRVAEALGLTVMYSDAEGWTFIPDAETFKPAPVPPYGEDSPEGWAATGPLMRHYWWTILRDGDHWHVCTSDHIGAYLDGEMHGPSDSWVDGDSPVEAFAELLVSLAAAGRLPEYRP